MEDVRRAPDSALEGDPAQALGYVLIAALTVIVAVVVWLVLR